jgi:hypothetical protein
MRITDNGANEVWREVGGTLAPIIEWTEDTLVPHDSPQEAKVAVPQQTLNVSRESVITTLEARATEEQKKREEANAARVARRQAAQDAVASLSPDELLNLVIRQYGNDLDSIVQMVEEAKETGRLKSQDLQESPVETAIAKYVRVLQMSTDATIEVTPTDDLYNLL